MWSCWSRYGLVGGYVSLTVYFVVSKTHAISSLSLRLMCLPAAMFPAMIITANPIKLLPNPQLNDFLKIALESSRYWEWQSFRILIKESYRRSGIKPGERSVLHSTKLKVWKVSKTLDIVYRVVEFPVFPSKFPSCFGSILPHCSPSPCLFNSSVHSVPCILDACDLILGFDFTGDFN